ncbi:MAG: transaldolase family protein [Methylocella sp.]
MGQSLWLDNITGNLLARGTLKKYIDTSSVTGLTSNPTIFDNAISRSNSYDTEIRRLVGRGLTGETLSSANCVASPGPPVAMTLPGDHLGLYDQSQWNR